MSESKLILELINIKKNFGDFEAISNISLQAKLGEFVCVIGPSGCGKTVLLSMIAGFLQPTSGEILMNGRPVKTIGTDRIMVFQDHMLFPWKTVMGNILFGLSKFPLPKSEKFALAGHYAELVGMSKFKDWPIHKLSGGMKQRVAFARALSAEPEILLMDEPFSSLDSFSRKQLRADLIDIWQKTKKTIIFVTHSINETVCLADTIYVLSARPAAIKKVYSVSLPRPRDRANPAFINLIKNIENDIII